MLGCQFSLVLPFDRAYVVAKITRLGLHKIRLPTQSENCEGDDDSVNLLPMRQSIKLLEAFFGV